MTQTSPVAVASARKWILRIVFTLALVGVGVALVLGLRTRPASVSASAFAENPDLDPGTALSGPAPPITLTDQFGRPVSLGSYRGKVVLLAFSDSQCTTICPLTTTEMLDAKRMLGAAGAHVALLGVNANPDARSVRDVRAYSEAHGMSGQWRFLTGSLPQLRHVWSAYHIAVQIEAGQIDHTPALYLIDQRGRLAKLYVTEMAYAGIDQQAQILAREISNLLPGHPGVHSDLSYTRIPAIDPGERVTLPRAGGGSISFGQGNAPRLVLFFATWDAETLNMGAGLEMLGRYVAHAAHAPGGHLPALLAIDQGDVEPTPAALPALLRTLPRPLPYPVAIDRTGRVADGYGVEDQPWLVLVTPSGRILWHDDVSTSGWPSVASLVREVHAALQRPLSSPPSAAGAAKELADSPPALAALHRQAGQLLNGGFRALSARLRALRGYPVVLNVWASWCPPCKKEFPLFAAAAARYGRRVAFLGADYEDSPGEARPFLAGHPVSYPSYEASSGQLSPLATITGTPTTIFIDAAGRVAHVHIGQYAAQGSLDLDVESYGF
ncbi:MAG TPA: redoxin domain-containing protein [Solirubrobacteraceae bacterium]|jgi:cytochrome c biogenesis protein CcmG/thiol:disulfide interchange protein DsbE|nr:redoxin domain-containing protein [Solirubrobacteraceae bacterium]